MFETLLVFAFCLCCGVFPAHLLLRRLHLSERTSLAIAWGYAPVLLAMLHLVNVLLGLEDSWGRFIVLLLPFLLLSRRASREELFQGPSFPRLTTILLSAVAGAFLCFVLSPDIFELPQGLHPDVQFNLGIVQQLKHHFPPHDPHWGTDDYYVYHYLGNMYLAAISSFLGLGILATYNATKVYLTISLCMVVGLMSRQRAVVSNLVIFVGLLVLSFANGWVLVRAFHGHLSKTASTFFWALPVFFASFVLWKYLDEHRSSFSARGRWILSLVLSCSVVFAKAPLIAAFPLLELFSFLRYVATHRILTPAKIREHLRPLTSFLSIPLASLLALAVLVLGSEGELSLGMEARDLVYFDSWSLLYPFLLVFLHPALFGLACYPRGTRLSQLSILGVAAIHLLVVFLLRDRGFSELYFGFTALLLVIIFFLESETKLKLLKVAATYYLAFLVFDRVSRPGVVVNDPFELEASHFSTQYPERFTFFRDLVTEYQYIGEQLGADALLAVKAYEGRQFKFSAFMGATVWNESNIYAHSTINHYTPFAAFLESQSFFPDYAGSKPDMEAYEKVYEAFEASFVPDASRLEDPEGRKRIYEQLAFGDWSEEKIREVLESTGITHIQIDPSDRHRLNRWIRSLPKIEGETVIVYACPRAEPPNRE